MHGQDAGVDDLEAVGSLRVARSVEARVRRPREPRQALLGKPLLEERFVAVAGADVDPRGPLVLAQIASQHPARPRPLERVHAPRALVLANHASHVRVG